MADGGWRMAGCVCGGCSVRLYAFLLGGGGGVVVVYGLMISVQDKHDSQPLVLHLSLPEVEGGRMPGRERGACSTELPF